MYQALYTKWRPTTFDDVYGQLHVTQTLKNEISSGRISHAYLFTGSRGTGKTTCARILSKAVNCLNPVNGNPCNECEICKGIDSDTIFDITEIDAASNNSVDNVRDLREEANFTPAVAKYRVYIIDEVHMLSSGAFNALLKTLEEPPAHVIFILATTEIHKLPATILSRCQRFDFKRIAPDAIVSRLNLIAEGENVTLTDEAANLIANISDGGMRDAISLLDRCVSSSDNIDSEIVSNVAGTASTSNLFRLTECISKRDCAGALKIIAELHGSYCDVDRICTGLSEYFRNLMVAYSVNNCKDLIVCSDAELEKYKAQAQTFRLSKILECIDIISNTSKIIKSAPNKKIQLESAIIKMCSAGNNAAVLSEDFDIRITELENKISSLMSGSVKINAPVKETVTEEKSEEPVFSPSPVPEKEEKANEPEEKAETSVHEKIINPPVIDEPVQPEVQSVPETKPEPDVPTFIPDGPFSDWAEVLENLMKSDLPLFGLLSDTSASVNMGKLVIQTSNRSLFDFINNEKDKTHYRNLLKAVFDVTGQKMKVVIHCVSEKQSQESTSNSPLDNLMDKINKFNQGE